jgi:hypothetical protein
MSQQVSENNFDDEAGISLSQIVDFLSAYWKKAVLGALAGAVLGVGGWAALASYKAESVLINNGAISFMSWRGLQKNLPILAAQMVETKQVRPDEMSQYNRLASAAWWQKNVVPTYSLTKADTKDLATISKDLQEAGGTNILNLVVTATGSSRETAEVNVDISTRFIKQGLAYLSIKNLINGYESQVLNYDADLQKKILDAEVELKFMRERAKNLEALRQRFPQNAAVGSQQIVDLKDSSAKYMPISTQLVAINTDINNTVESLQRMKDQLAQMNVLRDFVSQALPIVAKDTNGLALADALLAVEASMRQGLAPEDTNGLQMLNGIEATLVGFRTSFTKGLDTDLVPQVSRPGPMMPAVGGLVGGAVLVLMLALARKSLNALKARAAS